MGKYILRLGNTVNFCTPHFSDQLSEAKRLGFDTIDFNIANAWYNEEIENKYYERLDEGIDAALLSGIPVNGVHISLGQRWDISDIDDEKRCRVVEKISDVFKRTDRLDPYCYIIHPSFEPVMDEERERKIEALKKSARALSSSTSRMIALETIPRSCLMNTSREAAEIIDSIALPNVKICMDVNHFLYEKSEDAALKLGSRIVTTHISDHDYENERHWLPKRGRIDWMKLLLNLERTGYNGVFNYEVEESFEEVKRSYEELFLEYNKDR